jgi:casein kinase I family protein HRR25
LRALFRGLADRVGVKYDAEFDWSVSGAGDTGKGRSAVDSPGGIGSGSGGRRYCEACNARNNARR